MRVSSGRKLRNRSKIVHISIQMSHLGPSEWNGKQSSILSITMTTSPIPATIQKVLTHKRPNTIRVPGFAQQTFPKSCPSSKEPRNVRFLSLLGATTGSSAFSVLKTRRKNLRRRQISRHCKKTSPTSPHPSTRWFYSMLYQFLHCRTSVFTTETLRYFGLAKYGNKNQRVVRLFIHFILNWKAEE